MCMGACSQVGQYFDWVAKGMSVRQGLVLLNILYACRFKAQPAACWKRSALLLPHGLHFMTAAGCSRLIATSPGMQCELRIRGCGR